MERANLTTATFEAPLPHIAFAREVLNELADNGDTVMVRTNERWRERITDLADRLLEEDTFDPRDTLVWIAVSAFKAAEQLEGAA